MMIKSPQFVAGERSGLYAMYSDGSADATKSA
jgi:hypothetical protein